MQSFSRQTDRRKLRRPEFISGSHGCPLVKSSIHYEKTNTGFTLAEVLITLGIIGVVAAMTIPTLMNVTQNLEYKTAYKKAYSTISQALSLANTDDALNPSSDYYDVTTLNNFKAIMNYLKTSKTCYNAATFSECWAAGGESYNISYPNSGDFSAIDASGMSWSTYGGGYDFSIFVDTNGCKKPNIFGKDRFKFSSAASDGSSHIGIPVKIYAEVDNDGGACMSTNECATKHNYYSKTWLMN